MKISHAALALCSLGLLSCTVEGTGSVSAVGQSSAPPEVLAMAAPNQNLATAVLREADGCYWYTYAGPVETTQLPLRTRDGRPICNQQAVEAATVVAGTGG